MNRHDRDITFFLLMLLSAVSIFLLVFRLDGIPQQVENKGEMPCYSTQTKT
ncbi:MAG: hypothetical protein Tp1125DCM00d2C21254131_29 [Prokaryotic dsDNA virus sp.]|nr:MAG: hypothetical protein Tp1125DCM00d2C21254131_29 [Prokaryotic dsDNA virus sp.]